MRSMSSRNARASPTVTRPVPATAIALRFLEPIRAPVPPRPALWYWSLETQAQGSLCSPAGPIDSEVMCGSKSARRAASMSAVSMPAYLAAGTKLTLSSLMSTAVSSAAQP
jgi:hypothetical protein